MGNFIFRVFFNFFGGDNVLNEGHMSNDRGSALSVQVHGPYSPWKGLHLGTIAGSVQVAEAIYDHDR